MPGQIIHRFTVKDYYRMAEGGVLDADERVELLNGEVFDKSPISPSHGGVVKRLNHIFSLRAKNWLVSVQSPLHVDDYSEPEPDVMLLKPSPDFYRRRHPQPED